MENLFCSDKYDKALMATGCFDKHKEYLPYVGVNYEQTKILLIGESHYIASNEFKESIEKDWYNKTTDEIFKRNDNSRTEEEKEDEKYIRWFTTQAVLEDVLYGCRAKGYSMYKNPAKVMIEIANDKLPTINAALSIIAFCNYYQRPSVEKGASIINSNEDNEVAAETLKAICDVIKPELVIFLSKKSFNAWTKAGVKINNVEPTYVNHPTCSHWNVVDGKEKFKSILEESGTLKDLTNIKDTQAELLKTLLSELIIYLNKNNIKIVKKCSDKDIYNYYKSDSNKLELIKFENEYSLKLDHCPFLEMEDNKWVYLPTNFKRKIRNNGIEGLERKVPNFKSSNDAYIKLFEDMKRHEFIEYCIEIIKEKLKI